MARNRLHNSGSGVLKVQRHSDCLRRPGSLAVLTGAGLAATAASAARRSDPAPTVDAATIPPNTARRLVPLVSSDISSSLDPTQPLGWPAERAAGDRKSTRLNSSHPS